jgi:xylitol oxidase
VTGRHNRVMRNWAANVEYGARRLVEPRSLDELREVVRAAGRFRVIGSRHSFNGLPDTDGDLLSLARLPRVLEIDPAASTVTIDGAMRYGDLVATLDAAGFALHNLASLPHISVAGAVATGTHGSGVRSRGLASAVRRVELLRTDGELVAFDRDADPDAFPGVVVSLGAMGVATRLTLDLEPAYEVAQVVYEDLSLDAFRSRFDVVMASGSSVSAFTTWQGAIDQLWIKRRVPAAEPGWPEDVFGAMPATGPHHPVPGMDPIASTAQLGVPGPWYDRLPHFRLQFTPSAGDELQSEWIVGRADAVAAFDALDALRDRLAPLVFVTEIRTIAADDLWLSPAWGRDSAAVHFTWRPRWPEVSALLPEIEAALVPFGPRPHWGKLFAMAPAAIAAGYPRLADARALAIRLDPEGKLRNPYLDAYLFGGAAP